MKKIKRFLLGLAPISAAILPTIAISAGCAQGPEAPNIESDEIKKAKEGLNGEIQKLNELIQNHPTSDHENYRSINEIANSALNDAKAIYGKNGATKAEIAKQVEKVKNTFLVVKNALETVVAQIRKEFYVNWKDYNNFLKSEAKNVKTKRLAIDKEKDKDKKEKLTAEFTTFIKSLNEKAKPKLDKVIETYNKLQKGQSSFDIQTVRIFHSNDEHGRIKQDWGKYNNFAGMVGFSKSLSTMKNSYDLLLSAGDLIQGLPFSDSDHGKTITQIAAKMGYAAIAVGNHEFDFGLDHTLELDKLIAPTGTRFLSANVRYKKDANLLPAALKDKAGQRPYTPYLIKELANGLKVALIGITTPDSAYTSHPKNSVNVDFIDPVEATKEVLAEIKEKHPEVNFTIALTHLGVGRNVKEWESTYLADNVPELDLILDGHSHTKYDLQPQNESLISQTECYTKYLGDIVVDFDKKEGKIIKNAEVLKDIDQILIEEANSTLDKDIQALIDNLQKVFNVEYSQNAFKINVNLTNVAPVTVDGNEYWIGRTKQSTLGMFSAEAIAWNFYEAKKAEISGLSEKNIIGLQNGGGIRADLTLDAPGVEKQLIRENVLAVSPFGNMVEAVKVKGSVLLETIKHGLSKIKTGAYAQWSGNLKMTVNVKKVNGKTVHEVDEDSIYIGGTPLDLNADYYIVANDFMIAGGDGYDMLNYSKHPDKASQAYQNDSLFETFIGYGKHLNELAGNPSLEDEPFAREMSEYGQADILDFITYKNS